MSDPAPAAALTPEQEWEKWLKRYSWHLDQVPGIFTHLAGQVVPIQAFRYDRPRVSGSSESAPLPFRAEVADSASELWSLLATYCGAVARALPDWLAPRLPSALPAVQLRAHAAALTAVAALEAAAEDIGECQAEEVLAAEDALFRTIRRLRAIYMVPVRLRGRPRLCVLCGLEGVVVMWINDENGRARQIVRCRQCGQTYEESDES